MSAFIAIVKAQGNPPHPGLVLLPSKQNPKVMRWQRIAKQKVKVLKEPWDLPGETRAEAQELPDYTEIQRLLEQRLDDAVRKAKDYYVNTSHGPKPELLDQYKDAALVRSHTYEAYADAYKVLHAKFVTQELVDAHHEIKSVLAGAMAIKLIRERAIATMEAAGAEVSKERPAWSITQAFHSGGREDHPLARAYEALREKLGTAGLRVMDYVNEIAALDDRIAKISLEQRITSHAATYREIQISRNIALDKLKGAVMETFRESMHESGTYAHKAPNPGFQAQVWNAIEKLSRSELRQLVKDNLPGYESVYRTDLVTRDTERADHLWDEAVPHSWLAMEARYYRDHHRLDAIGAEIERGDGTTRGPNLAVIGLRADEIVTFGKGEEGDHWGSADAKNTIAAGNAFASGTVYRPLPDLKPVEHVKLETLIEGWKYRVYAQKRIKEAPKDEWPSVYRGMQLPFTTLTRLVRARGAFMPLTGATAFTFDVHVAEHYSSSKWTQQHSAGYKQEAGVPVILEIARDEAFDKSVSFWHENLSRKIDEHSVKGPAFEILTGAPALQIVDVQRPNMKLKFWKVTAHLPPEFAEAASQASDFKIREKWLHMDLAVSPDNAIEVPWVPTGEVPQWPSTWEAAYLDGVNKLLNRIMRTYWSSSAPEGFGDVKAERRGDEIALVWRGRSYPVPLTNHGAQFEGQDNESPPWRIKAKVVQS